MESESLVLEPIAADQAVTLQNLYELYVYDFSELTPQQLRSDGRFGISPGDKWWTQEHHYPFFIKCSDKLCGFALVRRGSRVTAETNVMDVAEFFVVRGARGKKIGMGAAHALFRAFPGDWEIRVRRSNPSAMRFWSRVTEAWLERPALGGSFIVEGDEWDVLRVTALQR